jgi:hypothetical protein
MVALRRRNGAGAVASPSALPLARFSIVPSRFRRFDKKQRRAQPTMV